MLPIGKAKHIPEEAIEEEEKAVDPEPSLKFQKLTQELKGIAQYKNHQEIKSAVEEATETFEKAK